MKYMTMFRGEPMEVDDRDAVSVLYTNYKGTTGWRRIIPLAVPIEKFPADAPYHAGGWVMHVFDLDKMEDRSYALASIHYMTELNEVTDPFPVGALVALSKLTQKAKDLSQSIVISPYGSDCWVAELRTADTHCKTKPYNSLSSALFALDAMTN